MNNVEEPDTAKYRTRSGGQAHKVTFINESGLYSLILSPKLPNAEAFKMKATDKAVKLMQEKTTPQMLPIWKHIVTFASRKHNQWL